MINKSIAPPDAIQMIYETARWLRSIGFNIWIDSRWPTNGEYLSNETYKVIYDNIQEQLQEKLIYNKLEHPDFFWSR
ncbi:MAG: hypothetical protein ABIJ12_14235 [bacterium]